MDVSPENCFSAILAAAIEQRSISPARFSEILHDLDPRYKLTRQRISEYLNRAHTPPFDKAKFMLEALDVHISDEELKDLLFNNKMLVKENSEKYVPSSERELFCSLRIKYRNLYPGIHPKVAESILFERLESLDMDSRSISKYIQGLIAKDLREYSLSKEEVEKID